MAEPTFDCPDLDSFCLLDRLGLTVTGQQVLADHTVLACRIFGADDVTEQSCWCPRCGELGAPRDTVLRRLAHVPMGWRPTVLQVTGWVWMSTAGATLGRAPPGWSGSSP